MKRNTLLAAMALAATALGTAASAESHHGHGGQPGDKGGAGMMQNGGPGMMGNMGGMMQMFDADGDGTTTPDEMRTQLQTKLTEYDSDGDGSLSIAEFEALHSEMMVDRFQHLDADGDGAVTPEEMAAPADRMERMQSMRSNMTDAPARPGNGQGMGDGSMMQGN